MELPYWRCQVRLDLVVPPPLRFVLRAPSEGTLMSGRAEMLLKASAIETGGAFSLIETRNPPGGGPPLHLHDSVDEAFYVLDAFVCGEEHVAAGPDCFIFCRTASHTAIRRVRTAAGC